MMRQRRRRPKDDDNLFWSFPFDLLENGGRRAVDDEQCWSLLERILVRIAWAKTKEQSKNNRANTQSLLWKWTFLWNAHLITEGRNAVCNSLFCSQHSTFLANSTERSFVFANFSEFECLCVCFLSSTSSSSWLLVCLCCCSSCSCYYIIISPPPSSFSPIICLALTLNFWCWITTEQL